MAMLVEFFRHFGPAYQARFGDRMLPSHVRTLADILRCRTPACGGHLYACADCGARHFVAHSCRNRHCPTCGGRDTIEWLAARREELLDTGYYHLVFTLPATLRELCRSHQRTAYNLLFKSAHAALQELANDPRYVGGQLAIMSVLHTWTRALVYHPHVHCLVAAGGLGADGRWRRANPAFLVSWKALGLLFRGKFLAALAKALPGVEIPRAVWQKGWVVFSKYVTGGADHVLNYLGRYLYRVAITDGRIVRFDEHTVTFRYRDEKRTGWLKMTLSGHEFIRRFLQHVLPRGCHKVRYAGLWHPANRQRLRQVAAQLTLAKARVRATPVAKTTGEVTMPIGPPPIACPCCGSLRQVCLEHHSRAPPWLLP